MAANEEHQAAKQTRKLQERAADRAFMVRWAESLLCVKHAPVRASMVCVHGRTPVSAAPDGVHWIHTHFDRRHAWRYARCLYACDIN